MNSDSPLDFAHVVDVIRRLPYLLREKRKRDELTQREAAQQIGISQTTVFRIENGDGVVLRKAEAALCWLADIPHTSATPDTGRAA